MTETDRKDGATPRFRREYLEDRREYVNVPIAPDPPSDTGRSDLTPATVGAEKTQAPAPAADRADLIAIMTDELASSSMPRDVGARAVYMAMMRRAIAADRAARPVTDEMVERAIAIYHDMPVGHVKRTRGVDICEERIARMRATLSAVAPAPTLTAETLDQIRKAIDRHYTYDKASGSRFVDIEAAVQEIAALLTSAPAQERAGNG